MVLLYSIVAFLFLILLISVSLYPFYKVWLRLKKYNRDLWNGMGPFTLFNLISDGAIQAAFMRIINKAESKEYIKKRDPELIKWTIICKALITAFPRGFWGQVTLFFIILFIINAFSGSVVTAIHKFIL